MCWTISEPVPSGAGSRGISSPSAFGPPVEDAIRTTLRVAVRGRASDARGGRSGGRRGERRAGGGALAGFGGVADLARQLGGEVRQRLAHRGLGHEVDRALGERVDGAGAVRGGEGRHHDDRDRLGLAGAQRAQHAEAVEARHVQVERQRVGAVLVAGGERLVTVGRRGDHVEALASQGVGEDPAHEPRVVGDDDALPAVRDGGHARGTTPRRARRHPRGRTGPPG